MSKCAELWLKTGVIKNPVNADTLIDPFATQKLPDKVALPSSARCFGAGRLATNMPIGSFSCFGTGLSCPA